MASLKLLLLVSTLAVVNAWVAGNHQSSSGIFVSSGTPSRAGSDSWSCVVGAGVCGAARRHLLASTGKGGAGTTDTTSTGRGRGRKRTTITVRPLNIFREMSAFNLHMTTAQDGIGDDVDVGMASSASPPTRSPKRKLGEMSLSEEAAAPVSTASPSAAPVAVTDDDGGTTSCLSDIDVDVEAASTGANTKSAPLRPPLRFIFKGWSVWLDVEEPPGSSDANATITTGPFTEALAYAASRHSVHPIPAPHVTVIYGIDHIDEDMVLRRFRSLDDSLVQLMLGRNDTAMWPPLTSKGVLSDIEIDGVNGGTMTMAWSEISLQTSELQESLVEHVWDVMMCGMGNADDGTAEDNVCPVRPAPWVPHLSLCYDNPEETPLNLIDALDVVAKHPFLLGRDEEQQGHGEEGGGSSGKQLRLTGLSLWNTEGTMDEWCCLDRIAFPR